MLLYNNPIFSFVDLAATAAGALLISSNKHIPTHCLGWLVSFVPFLSASICVFVLILGFYYSTYNLQPWFNCILLDSIFCALRHVCVGPLLPNNSIQSNSSIIVMSHRFHKFTFNIPNGNVIITLSSIAVWWLLRCCLFQLSNLADKVNKPRKKVHIFVHLFFWSPTEIEFLFLFFG